LTGCALRLGRMTDEQKAERLAVERGRLTEFTNPIDKTKSYITISEILLDFTGDAAKAGDLDGMKTLLEQYVGTIEAAGNTLSQTDRNAERRPAGFKDLEIALRGQMRKLQDLGSSLGVDERTPVDAAMESATRVRERLLKLLFPLSGTLPATAG